MANSVVEAILNDIDNGKKLVILAGAGLSMAIPTEMDGGAEVAARVIGEIKTQMADFPDSSDPGQVYDEMVRRRGQPGIQTFVDVVQQVGIANYPVNVGHTAIIKLYLEGVIDQVYSLNVDPHLEHCSYNVILPSGWHDTQNLEGTARTHPMCFRYGLNAVVPPGKLPWLQKVHGCMLLDPLKTIWSAALLALETWPADAAWAQAGFEGCIQNRSVVIVGCGYPVSYVNRSIQRGKQHSAAPPPSYLVCIDTFDDYSTNKNPALVHAAGVPQANYLQQSATQFLPELHAEFCKRVLSTIRGEISAKWDSISNASVPGSLFPTRRPAIDQAVGEVMELMKSDLTLLQKVLRRSFLWRTDVSRKEIETYYVSLKLNKIFVGELLGMIALVKASFPDCTLGPQQAVCTLKIPEGRQILAVHCRGTSAVQVRDEIICGFFESQGPLLPENLLLILLDTDALATDISKMPPKNRTRSQGKPSSRVVASKEMPASWRLTTTGDTINRAPFMPVAEWDTLIRGLII